MKSNYYLIYPNVLLKQIHWPDSWGNRAPAHFNDMLMHELNVGNVGYELKLCFGIDHKWEMVTNNNVTPYDIEDYFKAAS